MRIVPIVGSALLLVTMAACSQKTETNSTVGETGTVQSSTTTITTPSIDTAATAAAAANVQDAAHNTGTAINDAAHDVANAGRAAGHEAANAGRNAAHATGTAMETAGKSIQRHAKPGDQH